MYKSGDLRLGRKMDSRGDYEYVDGAYLPHACDSWVIGGREQMWELVADLLAAIEGMKER